jgi:hypothetical protein
LQVLTELSSLREEISRLATALAAKG